MAEISFHPAAQRDCQVSIAWYQERSNSAARRFVAEIESTLSKIAAQPDFFAPIDGDFREAILVRFPFGVVYRIDSSGDCLVVAVAHASREPGYWEHRVS